MLGSCAIVRLLAIVVLVLVTTIHLSPYDVGTAHGTGLAVTQGMAGESGECDRGHLPTTARCQVNCTGMAAAFVMVPVLPLPERTTGWIPMSDVRGSGRDLAPDLPPPKSGGVV
jgi:hypothetical protein